MGSNIISLSLDMRGHPALAVEMRRSGMFAVTLTQYYLMKTDNLL